MGRRRGRPPCGRQRSLQPERLDEGRLADAGYPGNADAMGIAAVGKQLIEQRRRLDTMPRQDRFDERDRLTDRGPITASTPAARSEGTVPPEAIRRRYL